MKSTLMSRAAAVFATGSCATLILALFAHMPQVAAKGKPGGDDGGSSSGYKVTVDYDDVDGWPGEPPANQYAPGISCPGNTLGNNYFAAMLDDGDTIGNSCGIVPLYDLGESAPNGYALRDEVGFIIRTRKSKGKSYFTGIVLVGQNDTTPESYWHKSVEIPLQQEVAVPTDPTASFTLRVYSSVLVQRYDSHLAVNNGTPVEDVGYVSIGKLVYDPLP